MHQVVYKPAPVVCWSWINCSHTGLTQSLTTWLISIYLISSSSISCSFSVSLFSQFASYLAACTHAVSSQELEVSADDLQNVRKHTLKYVKFQNISSVTVRLPVHTTHNTNTPMHKLLFLCFPLDEQTLFLSAMPHHAYPTSPLQRYPSSDSPFLNSWNPHHPRSLQWTIKKADLAPRLDRSLCGEFPGQRRSDKHKKTWDGQIAWLILKFLSRLPVHDREWRATIQGNKMVEKVCGEGNVHQTSFGLPSTTETKTGDIPF